MEQFNSCLVAYTLFLYRKELQRRNARPMKSRTKLHLRLELVSYSVERISEYCIDEPMNLNREIMFTRKLKNSMNIIKKGQNRHAIRLEHVS